MKNISLLILFFLICLGSSIYAQERDSLNKAVLDYKKCAAQQTQNQYTCSMMYLNKVNKLLDAAYIKLCEQIDTASCSALKREQVEWYSKRNVYYLNLDSYMNKKSKTTGAGMSDAVENINKKSQYVEARLETVLQRLESLKK